MSIVAHKVNGVPTGRYRVMIWRDGGRVSKYADNLKEARRIEATLKSGGSPDDEGKPKVYSVEDLWQEVRGLWSGDKNEKQSVARFEIACKALKEALGATPLPDIEVGHLMKARGILEARKGLKGPVSPGTVNRHLATLSKALDWADQQRKLKHLPRFDKVWMKEGKPTTFELSVEDEAKLRKALVDNRGDDYALILDVQVALGCRISELLGLEARDIVRHTKGNDAWTEVTFRDTKNGEDRVNVLEVEMGERLKALVERGMPHYAAIRRAMLYARKCAGLPLTQPTHAHRHTTATRMTQRGVSTIEVADYLGHKTLATTRRYAKSDTRSKRRALAILLGRET